MPGTASDLSAADWTFLRHLYTRSLRFFLDNQTADGLFLSDGPRRATFLPTVWRKLPSPDAFLAALLAKGGWPAGYWSASLRASRYTAQEFRDPAPREPLV